MRLALIAPPIGAVLRIVRFPVDEFFYVHRAVIFPWRDPNRHENVHRFVTYGTAPCLRDVHRFFLVVVEVKRIILSRVGERLRCRWTGRELVHARQANLVHSCKANQIQSRAIVCMGSSSPSR